MIYTMNYLDEHNFINEGEEMLIVGDTLKVNHFLHFETFASLTNTCAEDLQKLNPSVLRGAIPQSGKTYTMVVPSTAKVVLNKNRVAIMDSASKAGKKEIELLAKTYTGPTYGGDRLVYKVKSGDVLGSIALRHRVSLKDLKRWNNLHSNNINIGQRLTIYAKGKGPVSSNTSVASGGKTKVQTIDGSKIYTVQPGDTLWTISRKFDGLTIEKIKSMNKLDGNNIKAGQTLIIGI
jgi:membrane-bound lytic murein transglycosylase D